MRTPADAFVPFAPRRVQAAPSVLQPVMRSGARDPATGSHESADNADREPGGKHDHEQTRTREQTRARQQNHREERDREVDRRSARDRRALPPIAASPDPDGSARPRIARTPDGASAVSANGLVHDADAYDESVRALAIRLAGEACARALHQAIARNPLFVARFVDDALRAAGGQNGARARVRHEAAAACANRVRCDLASDDALAPGEVVVETASGSVRATLEDRAQILVRAAADA